MELLFLIVGLIVGIAFSIIIQLVQTSYGVLRIDQSKEEKDTYRIEFRDLDSVKNKKRIVLRVDPKADLSLK